MSILLDVTSGLFLLMGSFLCLTGGLGILRFPDFYTRMHAVGVTDTLATAMILIGLILHNLDFLVDVKVLSSVPTLPLMNVVTQALILR